MIKNISEATRAMTLAFKLANKSINKSRPRRVQCLATAKKLIQAAEDFTAAQDVNMVGEKRRKPFKKTSDDKLQL